MFYEYVWTPVGISALIATILFFFSLTVAWWLQPPSDIPPYATKIRGKIYDLRNFQHPGGNSALALARGRDATVLFDSYHVWNEAHEAVLKKLPVLGGAHDPDYKPLSDFHKDLKKLARQYAKESGQKRLKITWGRFCLCVMLVPCYVATAIAYFKLSYWGLLWPVFTMLLGLQLSHDGSHFSVSRIPWINRLLTWTSVWPWVYNPGLWMGQHVVQHHVYTNDHKDPDLYHAHPLSRTAAFFKWRPWMILMQSATLVIQPFIATLTLSSGLGIKAIASVTPELFAVLWHFAPETLFYIFGTTLTWVWPIFYKSIHGLWLPIAGAAISSVWFIAITQVSHLQDGCFNAQGSWAKRQVASTKDYSQDSRITSVLSGGLNTQALHHVLPVVHSSHYTDLYPHFRKVCQQHNVRILEMPSLWHGIAGWMKRQWRLSFPNAVEPPPAQNKAHNE